MTTLTFNETTYEFRVHYGQHTNDLHIIVNGELKKVRRQQSYTPQTIAEALELIELYELNDYQL